MCVLENMKLDHKWKYLFPFFLVGKGAAIGTLACYSKCDSGLCTHRATPV